MASRLEKIGSIYARVSNLLSKRKPGSIEKPLWFDIYTKYPPIQEPLWNRPPLDIKVKEIFYEEDKIRAKVHKALKNKLTPFNLADNRNNNESELPIKLYQDYVSQGLTEDEAIQKLTEDFNKDKQIMKNKSKMRWCLNT
ncbi:mitochondrial ribosomal protein S23, putative [Pediculus humanus corporis]|uniref:Small ribosomal subunit protein mS23 n=1 Tax=Pediculus humanus subsp. corporis TaxID=121224 RepID=E0VTF1_PEDHC|nr:mitochondrial ribosomal protein S23, putative [Pediculus humanus corporis]EEB16657.1 mitochondrial ribosomal protein S23, putative [Pediculus humanus corporis]